MKLEATEKDQSLKLANKRARVEERSRSHISAANQDLRKKIAECEKAVGENEQFKRVIRELEQQVSILKVKIEKQESHQERNRRFDQQNYTELIKEYQGRLEEEQLRIQTLTRAKEAALEENWQLKGEVMNLEAAQVEAQRRLVDFDRRMNETIALYVEQYEEKITDVEIGLSETIHRLRVAIDRKDEELRGLHNWAEERGRLLRLIKEAKVNYIEAWYGVAHWAHKMKDIRMIPGLVRNAKTMVNPLTTPREAVEFIDVCKGLVEAFEGLVEQAKKDVAKEFAEA